MTERGHGTDRPGRIALAVAIVVLVLSAAAMTAGVGFAKDSTSAAQYQYGKKVTLCHKTHSTKHPWVKITVSVNAVKAHRKHGDVDPPCPATAPAKKNHGKAKGHAKQQGTTPPQTQAPSQSQAPGKSGDDHGKAKGKGK